MEKIRCLIIDDEPLARSRIRKLLDRDPEVEVLSECVDGFQAVTAIRELKPDLIFLDIQMPEMDGFQVLEQIRGEQFPVVVFVTAFDQHALRAFQVYALDYLLKPFDQERFRATVDRARKLISSAHRQETQSRMLSLLEEWSQKSQYVQRVMIKENGRMAFVNVEEIDWIEAEGNYVNLHAGKASYLLRGTINNMEAQLDPANFLRIHRSTIVNINRIQEIQQLFHGEYMVVLRDGTKLKLSRSYKAKLPF